MIEIIEYKGKTYPKFQSIGMASQFAIPFAKHVCIGEGYDIGCMKKEWAFPGSIPIDLDFEDELYFRKYIEKEDKKLLRCLNSKYEDIELNDKFEVRGCIIQQKQRKQKSLR